MNCDAAVSGAVNGNDAIDRQRTESRRCLSHRRRIGSTRCSMRTGGSAFVVVRRGRSAHAARATTEAYLRAPAAAPCMHASSARSRICMEAAYGGIMGLDLLMDRGT